MTCHRGNKIKFNSVCRIITFTMYEKTICKMGEIFFYSLKYLDSWTMPKLLSLRHYFDDKFSTRTSIQTKVEMHHIIHTFSFEVCLFVWFDSLRPINNLSVIKGRVFLGRTSTKLGLMFLLKDTTQWRRWGSNPRPFGLESSTLPLSHCAPFFIRGSQPDAQSHK